VNDNLASGRTNHRNDRYLGLWIRMREAALK
jgi:hypothetical protein